ncbi:MAG: hypothetical protein KatS3mg124_1102 [Porticoccaceae bacterium]|nr:MAG: hypothetical protein KatS3mg124_1102 [Porticoccaceae bacterium]
MAARLGTAVVVIAALAIGGLASAQASEPCCAIAGPIAWGEVAFLAEDVLAVPTAEVVEADAAQRAEEAARRREWLSRPRKERLDELVERDPDEGEAMYRFRRWVAERYLEFLDRSPAPEGGTRRLTGLGVALFRLRDGGIEPMARIPLWRGDVPVHSQISHHGGLGGASWTLEMVNAWAGAHPGPRWTVLWAWPDRGYGGEPLAALLRAVDPPEPEFLGAFLPLDWQDADSLIALGRRDGAWWLLRVRLDSAGTLLAEERLARAPSPSVTVTVVPGGSTRRFWRAASCSSGCSWTVAGTSRCASTGGRFAPRPAARRWWPPAGSGSARVRWDAGCSPWG